jgi:hypothetical protein
VLGPAEEGSCRPCGVMLCVERKVSGYSSGSASLARSFKLNIMIGAGQIPVEIRGFYWMESKYIRTALLLLSLSSESLWLCQLELASADTCP